MLSEITFVLLIFVIVSSTGLLIYQQRQIGQAKRALCAFRSDLERRIDRGQHFLDTHPEGVAGVSASDLRSNLVNQRATFKSLDSLTCKELPTTTTTTTEGK